MAHSVIEIRMRSLSESLRVSPSSDRAAAPLISPSVISGQFLSVDLRHSSRAVFHARICPLLVHSSHRCCYVSIISMFCFFLQNGQIALSSCPGILFQYVPHLILPVSMVLMWSLTLGGTFSLRFFVNPRLLLTRHGTPQLKIVVILLFFIFY
jgi:hypothetical protein